MPSSLTERSPIRSTYRLQLGPRLTFADAAALADYLAEIGVTHAYLSPILAAGTGSTHGYDVVDHSRVDPELGGARAFAALVKTLRAHGVGVVLDIVPNHMAIPVPESLNRALWSVLRDGQASEFAAWFDIDWAAGGGRVALPVLDGPLRQNLPRLSVERRRGEAVAIRYFDHRFPLAERSGDRGARIRLLTEFHTLLASLGENRALEEFVRHLAVKTSLAVVLYDHVGSACAIEEHSHLIDLIAAGDIAGAVTLMTTHLTTNQSRLPTAVEARPL